MDRGNVINSLDSGPFEGDWKLQTQVCVVFLKLSDLLEKLNPTALEPLVRSERN